MAQTNLVAASAWAIASSPMMSSFCCSSSVALTLPTDPKMSRNAARLISEEMTLPALAMAFSKVGRWDGSSNPSLGMADEC